MFTWAGFPVSWHRGLFGAESVDAWQSGHPVGAHAASRGANDADALAKVNVAVQIDRLATLPVVRDALLAGRLHLTGMYYDIGTAQVQLLDRARSQFAAPWGHKVPA